MTQIKIRVGNHHQRELWSPELAIFTTCRSNNGPLAVRRGRNFGASYASIILGPDLALGQGPVNAPSVGGAIWDTPVHNGPQVTFTNDDDYIWIRGHLINGRWGGSGANWNNLTPLTALANSNHKTVEGYMDNYIHACRLYDKFKKRRLNGTFNTRANWYGVYYCVQCSQDPFAHGYIDADAELYSYAPEFIKVSWRAVTFVKPVGQNVHTVIAGMNVLPFQAVPAFPVDFHLPPIPAAMNGQATLPAWNAPGGGNVLGALPLNFPVAQPNGFDGAIEIHQS